MSTSRPDLEPIDIRQVHDFCLAVYTRTFGVNEGRRRLDAIRPADAIALWREGLPHSNLPIEPALFH